MLVEVDGETADVHVVSTATCSLGGSSVPMDASVSASPFADLTVTLGLTEYDDTVDGAVDPSLGLTVSSTLASVAFSSTV